MILFMQLRDIKRAQHATKREVRVFRTFILDNNHLEVLLNRFTEITLKTLRNFT